MCNPCAAIASEQDIVMPEERDKNNTESSSLNTKDIIAAVRELNICLKSVNIYPAEHDQVKTSIDRSLKALGNIFNHLPDLTLAITGNNLMTGNEYLDPDNPVCKEFALSLKLHDIAAITWYREIERNELTRLLILINRKPDDMIGQGGMAAVFEKENFQHINIKTVDYSKLSLTEEKEISRGKNKDKNKDDNNRKDTVWKNFVSHLISDTLSDATDGISINTLDDVNPAELAGFINENRIHTETALKSYRHVVAEHFREPGDESKPISAAKNSPPAENGPILKRENLSYDLRNWNKLLEELNTEVKQQFLAVSFDHCEKKGESARTEEFLGSMSGSLVIDMLRTANQTGNEISPSLISLIKKLSAAQEDGLHIPADLSAAFDRTGDNDKKTKEQLQVLFDREQHEEYVVEEYDDVLKKLTADSFSGSALQTIDFSVDDHLPTLEDHHLNSRISRILIGFMNGNIDKEDYEIYSGKLVSIAKDTLDIPDFSLLRIILKSFIAHQKNKTDEDIRRIAKESILKFREPAFTSKAVAAFFKNGELSDQDGFHFLIALGPRIVPDLVKLFAEQDKPEIPGLLSGLITHFRKETIVEAQKRLNDTRSLFVRNLIVMLRILNAQEAEGRLKLLLDHENMEIQMEALETLLQFNNQWAMPVLKKMVQSYQADISSKAVFLCGKYKVKDMAVILMSMLKTFIIFKADIKKNEEIISALGQIADPQTIPVLDKLITRRPLLHSKEIAKMKLLAYQSLSGYSVDDSGELLKKGITSKNSEVATICKKIINQKHGELSR